MKKNYSCWCFFKTRAASHHAPPTRSDKRISRPTIPQRHSLPVIMQSLVYASDIFHHRQNRTDIMGNQDDSALFIGIFQELIKTRLESFIHIRIRLIQDQYLRTETIERPNKTRCNWPPESSPMALPANSSNPICTITSLHALSGIY